MGSRVSVPGFRSEPMTIYNNWVPVGSGFRVKTKQWVSMGSGLVPKKRVPGSGSEPKEWVPGRTQKVGSGEFRVGTQKVDSSGF